MMEQIERNEFDDFERANELSIFDDIPWTELLHFLDDQGWRGLSRQPLGMLRVRSSGTAYSRCVFHEERTPSLAFWAESGRYLCHGCGEAGDKIDFLGRLGVVHTVEEAGDLAQVIRNSNVGRDQLSLGELLKPQAV